MMRRAAPWLALIVTLALMAAAPDRFKIPVGLTCIILSYVAFRRMAAHE